MDSDLRQALLQLDRNSVDAALEECDAVGEARFLERYGYRPAERWTLEMRGRRYPPRTVLAAAFQYRHGRVLRPEDGPKHLMPDELREVFARHGGTIVDLERDSKSTGHGAAEHRVVAVHDEHGAPLDAHFFLDRVDGATSLVFQSRGGTGGSEHARNTEYQAGLRCVLARVLTRGWILRDAVVDSATTQDLTRAQRRIGLEGISYPVSAESGGSAMDLVRRLQSGMARIGRAVGATGAGNSTKRIRLYLDGPGLAQLGLAEVENRLSRGPTTADADAAPTADAVELDRRVANLRKRGPLRKPEGEPHPAVIKDSTRTLYERQPRVKAWVLQEAAGKCELCGAAAPFNGADGEPFLEVHHPVLLAAGGPDTPENAVALCPNCHRALHHAGNRAERLAALYEHVPRLLR